MGIAHHVYHWKQTGQGDEAEPVENRAPARHVGSESQTESSHQRNGHGGGGHTTRIVCERHDLLGREQRLHDDEQMFKDANAALSEAGLKYEGEANVRHMVEVLVEDIGFDGIKEKVKKPLEGLKIAGYVGCQTNRPFGIAGESFENPQYLDKIVESVGAESIPTYEKKVQCCGGALAFSEPEKSQEMIKGIIEAAYDNGADMIVTPCPLCQANTEIYQDQINDTYGTKFKMPVVYYSTLMSVAFGRSAKDAALDGHIIPAKQLEEIANK